MRIAVLGGGAMGALYGGYLSRKNDVLIVDVNTALIEKIKAEGLIIAEPDGSSAVYHPAITDDTKNMQPVDLVIVFVKAMFSQSALEKNRALIGSDTYLMTLQNGSGHEEVLRQFVDDAHVIIGTTQHNSAVAGLGEIRHGGSGTEITSPKISEQTVVFSVTNSALPKAGSQSRIIEKSNCMVSVPSCYRYFTA